MLKIRDNIDLKELEKFGFKFHNKQRNQYEHYSVVSVVKDCIFTKALLIVVYCDNRQIKIFDTMGQDILFDLIQAGLVEKMED